MTITIPRPIICIPICDVKSNNQQDLDDLLGDLSLAKDLFEVVCLYDSVEWVFRQYFLEKYPEFNHENWNRKKAHQFTKNSNIGLKYAKDRGQDCWLINQDTRIPHPELLAQVKTEGICSAQSAEHLPEYPIDSKFEPVYTDAEKFAFYATYFSKNALDKIGLMDERFRKVFSDDDYCLQCHLGNLPVQLVNIPIHHKGSYTKPSENGEFLSHSGCYNNNDLMLGLEIMKAKYNLPDSVTHEKIIETVLDNMLGK
jgi:hypothetical protein